MKDELEFCLLWVSVGLLLSIPYTVLAQGTNEHFCLAALIGPVVALWLFLIRKLDKKIYRLSILMLLLPILVNGGSVLIELIGWHRGSNLLFSNRYMSIPLALALTFLILSIKRENKEGGEDG